MGNSEKKDRQANIGKPFVGLRPRTVRLALFILFWLFMAYQLWEREIRVDFFDSRHYVETNRFFFESLSYHQQAKQVGFSCTLIRPPEAGSIRIEHRGSLSMSMLPVEGPVQYAGEIEMSAGELQLRRFHYTIQFDQGVFSTTGTRENEVLKVQYSIGGLVQEMSLPVPEEGVQMAMLSLPLLARKIPFEQDRNYRIRQFNVFLNQFEDVEITFGRERESVYGERLVSAFPMTIKIGDMESDLLVTREGRTLKETTSLGISAEQIGSKEMLFDLARKRENLWLLPIIPIVETRVSTEDGRLSLKVSGSSLDALGLSVPERQEWNKETRELVIQAPAHLEEASMEGNFAFLDGEPAQSVPVPIQRAAERILGTLDVAGQPERAVKLLWSWLELNVKDTVPIRPQNALRTLNYRAGGPAGKTRLFVELCRAARLPVTLVTGLAYEEGGFFLRRWARIDLREGRDIELYPPDRSKVIDETWIQIWEQEPPEETMVWLLTNLEFHQKSGESFAAD